MASEQAPIDDQALLVRVRAALTKWAQHHVLAHLDRSSDSSALQAQLVHFERWYRGGLDTYLGNATQLFHAQHGSAAASATASNVPAQVDAYADWLPSVPNVTPWQQPSDDASSSTTTTALPVAQLDSALYCALEALGLEHISKSAFVVVAGGLGERLGYNGIKLKLPVETLTHTSYLETYIQHLLALEELATASSGTEVVLPLAIMTSDVTHDATQAFLEANVFFGMRKSQVALLKQEKVPCLDVGDSDAQALQLALEHTATDASSTSPLLLMKPHGHGDVHALLHSSGLAGSWHASGKTFVHFFQDTNALIVHSFLPMLGASVRNRWAFAFTSVQRKAKDASGAVVRFVQPRESSLADDGASTAPLFNVEYHELDQFLRTKARALFPDGDVNDPRTGFSSFPGNINHVVVALAPYTAVLRVSGGFVPEVFNPKLAAATSSSTTVRFSAPARLECMVQDLPKLLAANHDMLQSQSLPHTTGLVLFPPALVYSPCKNDVASARAKALQDIPPQCAGSAEHDLFAVHRARLTAIGIALDAPSQRAPASVPTSWLGIPLDCSGPHVVLAPRFAPSQATLRKRFPSPAQIRITHRSTLVLDGDITIDALDLDGALRIRACRGARVRIKTLRVQNAGYVYASADTSTDLIVAMRGYVLEQRESRDVVFDAPGDYTVDDGSDASAR